VAADSKTDDWFVCPHCGEVLIGDPTNCRRCGADEETGWASDSATAGLGLPDDEFDYDEFMREEFGTGRRRWLPALWIVTGVLAALLAVLMLLT
jgi:hypothetical protein